MLKRLKSQILEVALQKIIMNDEIYLEQRKVVTLSLTLCSDLFRRGKLNHNADADGGVRQFILSTDNLK